jgi:signal transduction histidine kinase
MSTGPSSRSERVVTAVVTAVAALIGGFFLLTVLSSAMPAESPSPLEAVVFVAANAASGGLLWWHRRFPVPVFAAIFMVHIVSVVVTQMVVSGALTVPLWFSVFAVAAYATPRPAVIAIGAGWIVDTAVSVMLSVDGGYALTPVDVVAAFVGDVGFFYIACTVLGLGFRAQHQRARDAIDRVRLVEEHSRALHAEAVATERNRLARDLHDLSAHELVDALLAVRALRVTNDDPMLSEIEQKASKALENMRTVVRTLREGDGHLGDPERGPLVPAVKQLIDTLRDERGMTIDATVDVDAFEGPTEAGDDAVTSTVLSVLRETVLNAARHAPGAPVAVLLSTTPTDVRLRVTNVVPPHAGGRAREGTGYGLIGAAERARLLEGTFEAGRSSSGAWVASLRLPTASPVTTTVQPRETR